MARIAFVLVFGFETGDASLAGEPTVKPVNQ